MAKDKNTYAKRQRESLKKQKCEAKRERRRKRKEEPSGPAGGQIVDQPIEEPDLAL